MQTTVDEQVSAAGSQALLDLATGLPTDQLSDVANIHRIVGDFSYINASSGATTYGRFGIISTSLDAFTAGSVPELIGDFEAPWWYTAAYAVPAGATLQGGFRLPIDFKLNRRFGKNMALAFVLDVASGSNSSTNWGVHLRILYSHK